MHKRKGKRWLPAAVLGGTLAAGALAFLPAIAQAGNEDDGKQPTTAQADFNAAAAEFKVPVSVLQGVAHEESGWQQHSGYSNTGGWGLMNLTDVTPEMVADGEAGAPGRSGLASFTAHPELHTLRAAAKLTGVPAAQLQHDRRDNIRGGAALLASYQKQLTGSTSDDPSQWTAAIAKYSRMSDRKAATSYVDDVFATIASGAKQDSKAPAGSKTAKASKAAMAPTTGVTMHAVPSAKPVTGQLSKLRLKDTSSPQAECPRSMNCQFVPADPSNGQVSDRPANGIKINQIIIHTTEGAYDDAIKTFQTPGGASAQYVMRSSDGAVTQMVADKDVAFGDGNYDSNLHAVQIEHEGFSAHGADWYTTAAYQQTARLVRYLAARYDIPLDRQHILGHDNVPGPSDTTLSGMHWDPADGWDWTRFMRLLGAPFDFGLHGVGPVGSAVTITPGFRQNEQTYTVCPEDDPSGAVTACTPVTAPSSSLFVRSAPSDDAPLILDPVVHPDPEAKGGTDRVNDWSVTVQAGQQFVVAGEQDDWTAIWYDGQMGWIHNPGGSNTSPAPGARILRAAGTAAAPVYGTAYPDPSEYPAGLSPSKQVPLTAKNYSIPVGQAYVAARPPVGSADFFPTGGKVVTGAKRYYTVQFNHRYILVNAADVTVTRTARH
ncbi:MULTISPECIES: N-acetylmuramoyl-L-alanine amidase [unclassified Streptomyces]|uniref:N-acetylmuramoyl-L-alanine amidase n=1 Tax=unclassified Streptomyces TaxID=2593676 RepID=UPI002E23957E|nr:N-acetylmuramoyl-L-alanine amidase [Streptomyces sp. NBC_01023]